MVQYLNLLLYLCISIILAFIIFLLSYFLIQKQGSLEKSSAYECGFDPFDDARGRFDVRFYLVAILYIIFDLEVMFLFPWAVALSAIDLFGYISMLVFLGILPLMVFYMNGKKALWIGSKPILCSLFLVFAG